MFITLLRLIFGYCIIHVKGMSVMELQNLALRHRFFAVSAKAAEDGCCFSVSLRDKKTVLGLLAERQTVAVNKGLPFFLARYRRRAGLVVGAVAAAFMLSLSSDTVWEVEVIGNEKLADEEIIGGLEALGFGVGSRISKLDTRVLANEFLLRSEGVAWMKVNMLGTTASVQVVETVEPVFIRTKHPANIVASCDGRIVSVETYEGAAAVSPGDVVSGGELLISSVVDSKRLGARFVRAEGRVMASCPEEIIIRVPLEYVSFTYSNTEKRNFSIFFFGNEIKISGNSGNTPPGCGTIYSVYPLSFFGMKPLPAAFEVTEYKTVTEELLTRTEEEAAAVAYAELSQRMTELLSAPDTSLLARECSAGVNGGEYVIECRLTVLRNIATVSEIITD